MSATSSPGQAEPATTRSSAAQTEVGSVFVSNYPPYSFWGEERLPAVENILDTPPAATELGLYLHIPFCRKRCKFCYFRVYTDKNSSDIQRYLAALAREVELYSARPRIASRPLKFVYFGGGTPSYISARHLRQLVGRCRAALPWDGVEEVTFECEPGTLTQAKLEAIKEIGATRLSLGVENLDDEILRENGRAHLSGEVYQVAPWIKALEFSQVNVDLIAGMVGQTETSWRDTVQRTLDLDPDSVTIYQMELPFNTVYSKSISSASGKVLLLADWQTKRAWHDYAFAQFEAAGYRVASAYTVVKKDKPGRFVYRDSVWQGTDMMGLGVASFSHLGGVHFQNRTSWSEYLGALEAEQLPLGRAFAPSAAERLTREMILQLKLGKIDAGYFRHKFGAEILEIFAPAYGKLQDEGMLEVHPDGVELTRQGLLRIDQLLPEFYDPVYQNARYT